MKVPMEWLREFIDLKGKPEEIADRITMAGSEVAAIEFHGEGIEGVIVGKVKGIEVHGKADKLFVLQVDIGSKILQVVTNVGTLRVGDKVPVAQEGAKLANDIRVEVRELHGIESFGMLCSAEHLGLEESEQIMILGKDAPLGSDIKNILGVKGTLLEVDVLPNRGDLLSIIGFAREASAVFGKPLKLAKYRVAETGSNIKGKILIDVKDPDLCPRYMARVIEGISISESPPFIKGRLIACGLRPINNIVDITNYVLLEMGQPLHAFDLSLIEGKKIIVRRAKDKEQIVTLDEEKRTLDPGVLVIADERKPVAVAGVMGGKSTEVKISTSSILLESAYFNPTSINKTSRDLKVRTEASIRFERGVDWEGVEKALERAAALIVKYAGGKVCRGLIDQKRKDKLPKVIQLRYNFVNKVLGTALSQTEIINVVKRLGFMAAAEGSRKGTVPIVVPTCRSGDIEREIDLVEEIARIHGYEKIKSDMPRLSYSPTDADIDDENIDRIKATLAGAGFFEAQTFSIVSPKEIENLNIPTGDPRGRPITITNPLSEETSSLRTMLAPSLLKVISHNTARQMKDMAIFEVGTVFLMEGGTVPLEKDVLSLAAAGSIYKGGFNISGVGEIDLQILKGALETLFDDLGIKNYSFAPKGHFLLEGGRAACVKVGSSEIGIFGEVAEAVRAKYDINEKVYIAEIDLESILDFISSDRRFKPLGKYPKVSRDIAMFVPQNVSHSEIESIIKEIGKPILESVSLFDCYRGRQVPEGHVSLAYSVDYRDPNKTLTDEEVNAKHDDVLKVLSERLKVTIRKQ